MPIRTCVRAYTTTRTHALTHSLARSLARSLTNSLKCARSHKGTRIHTATLKHLLQYA